MKKWIQTQNPRRFPGFAVVVVTCFVKALDEFHDCVSECVSFPKKINNPFWEVTVFFFRRRVTIFIGRETKLHIFPMKIDEKIDKVSPSKNNIILSEQHNRGLWSSTSTFQFLVVEAPFLVFMVLSQDSVQHRCLPENAFLSGLWSRSLTLFLVEVFLVLSQVRVHLLLTLQLVLKNALMNLVKGFFTLFPTIKKSAKVTSHPGSELPPHPSSWTAAAQLEDSVEWVRLREKHAGKTYFCNRRTNSRVWRAGVEVVWYGEKDEVGSVWYWHRDTRVSTFDLPPLPPG